MSSWETITDRQTGILNFTPALNRAIGRTRIAVFGCGGNGAVLDPLVRTGFQHFHVVDPDFVEASNLNRLPFLPGAVGLSKVEAWRRYLQAVNPACEVHTHQAGVDRHQGALVEEILRDVDLVALEMSGFEGNFVVARVAAGLGKPMVVGPGTANCWVVSTFEHRGGPTMESAGGFGTEGQALPEIDYAAKRHLFARLNRFPGRHERLDPVTARAVRAGNTAPRSAKVFIAMVNAAQCFELVKNTALLHGLPLEGTGITAFPVLQMFDPWRGAAFYYDAVQNLVGIPDWITGDIEWRPAPEESRAADVFPSKD
jgi:molybdopterin/thiamine biosynthesis adenylyltransferase